MSIYFLPETDELGELTITKEYYRYDVPRAFVANSKLKQKDFLVYWVDEFEDYDTWYYVDFSAGEQIRVENGDIQLRDIFQFKKTAEIKTYYDTDLQPEYTLLSDNEVDLEALPPPGFAVRKISDNEYESYNRPLGSFLSNNEHHEIRLSWNHTKNRKKHIPWHSIQEVFGSWEAIYRTIVDSLDLKKPALQPALSKVGSYRMQFKASHNQELLLTASEIFKTLSESNGSLEGLIRFGIDLSAIESLLSNLSTYNLKFEFLTNSGNPLNTINTDTLIKTAQSLNDYNQTRIGSESIPQADEISRLITLVQKKYNGQQFNSNTENLVARQISYYVSAAKMLSLTKFGGQLTPIGQKLAEAQTPKEQAIILVGLFERSVCGWAWLKYSDVESVYDLKRESAVTFLLERSSGLSENTAKRRAVTLRKWLDTFKAYKSKLDII
jgi:hypothetical protein